MCSKRRGATNEYVQLLGEWYHHTSPIDWSTRWKTLSHVVSIRAYHFSHCHTRNRSPSKDPSKHHNIFERSYSSQDTRRDLVSHAITRIDWANPNQAAHRINTGAIWYATGRNHRQTPRIKPTCFSINLLLAEGEVSCILFIAIPGDEDELATGLLVGVGQRKEVGWLDKKPPVIWKCEL